MALLGVTKTANPTDNRQAVDSEGVALQGTASAARDQAFNVGGLFNTTKLGDDLSGSSAVQNVNGVTLAGSGNKNQLGGVQVGGANAGTINVNSAEGVEAVTKTFAETVKEFINGRPSDAANGVPVVPPKDESKPETKPGGGVETLALWGIGIVATLLSAFWLARRKKSA